MADGRVSSNLRIYVVYKTGNNIIPPQCIFARSFHRIFTRGCSSDYFTGPLICTCVFILIMKSDFLLGTNKAMFCTINSLKLLTEYKLPERRGTMHICSSPVTNLSELEYCTNTLHQYVPRQLSS